MHRTQVLAIPLALLLLGLAALAGALALADIYHVEGMGLVEAWSMSEELEVPPDWAWEEAHRYLGFARRLAPFDPDIRNDLGRLYELRVSEETVDEPGAKADLDRALGHYRAAVALRPAWPYVWANIALLKLKQDRLDAEFALAMERVATLGPWETHLQSGIAAAGLYAWDRLPAELQALASGVLQRGVAGGSRQMLALARAQGLIPEPAGPPTNTGQRP